MSLQVNPSILRRLKRYAIPVTTPAVPNLGKIPLNAIEFITGELLGDGCLMVDKRHKEVSSSKYVHSSKHKYIEWLSSVLATWGVEQVGKTNKLALKKGQAYSYQSRFYRDLLPLRELFYPEGKKVLPQSLRLTPIIVRQWYIGDGSLIFSHNKYPAVMLHTLGFTKKEVYFLSTLVSQEIGVGVTTNKCDQGLRIRIPAKDVEKFLGYIGPCPEEIVDVYGYKWNTKKKKGRC